MREIKFRLWDPYRKKMQFVYRLDFSATDNYIPCIYSKNGDIGDSSSVPIMQYTGLKDKNGKEIYEGDIITTFGGDPTGHIVAMDSNNDFPTGGFTLEYKTARYPIPYTVSKDAEVIGNIYENPELLKS